MNFVENKVYKLRPGYLPKFDEFIKTHSQFGGGATEDKYVRGKAFSNVYEFYIFSFFIGLYKDESMELIDDDVLKGFWEIENWKPREMVDHMLACALSKSNFNMLAVQEMEESEIIIEVRKLRRVVESYANGGLAYISALVE